MLNAGLTGYSGARGALGALKAHAPRSEVVNELLELPDADSCIARLRAMPFLTGVKSGEGLAALERDLRYSCVSFGMKLLTFVGGPAEELLWAYLSHYEIHNIKVIFRRAVSGKTDEPPAGLYPITPRYEPVSAAVVDEPEKIVDFVRRSPVADLVTAAFGVYRSNDRDVARFELALDTEWANFVWEKAGGLSASDGARLRKKVLVPVLGGTALAWALWLKVYRGLTAEEIISLVNVPRDVLLRDRFADLVAADDVPTALKAAGAPWLKALWEGHEVPADVLEWQRMVRRRVWQVTNAREISVIFDSSTILSALIRWEYVVDDAITVVRAKTLDMKREEIEALLAVRAA